MNRAVLRHILSDLEPTKLLLPYGSVVRGVLTDAASGYTIQLLIEQTVSLDPPGPTYRWEFLVVGDREPRSDLLDYDYAGYATDDRNNIWHVYSRSQVAKDEPIPMALTKED